MALALALRLVAAAQPLTIHPDEVFQYLEPARRLLGGEGVVTWEWRAGMRGWLLPVLYAPSVALADRIDPGGWATMLLPRLVAATASLSIVWSAWAMGRRASAGHAVTAALVAATWYELVLLGAHTLAEPVAAAALLPAAVLLTAPRPGARALFVAGALMGFAVVCRPHYAPGATVLAWLACRGELTARWRPVVAGGFVAVVVAGLADLSQGAAPLAWIIENVRQNIGAGRAADYGVAPPTAYVAWFETMWSWWTAAIAIGLWRGWRHNPPLFWAAVATVVVHSAIAHKEYRFVAFAVAAFVPLSALGWVDIARTFWSERRGSAAVALAWLAASGALASSGVIASHWGGGRGGRVAFARVGADPRACGVAIQEKGFWLLPGRSGLRPGMPLHQLYDYDPRASRAAWIEASEGFNRIVGPATLTPLPGFTRRGCAGDVCTFSRPGGCRPTDRFAIDAVLARVNQ